MHDAMGSSFVSGAPPSLAAMLQDGPLALFLDFDGTLVGLASGPNAISPLADMAARLEHLANRLGGRCAVISGRAIADIESHIGQLPVAAAGSHGTDIRRTDGMPVGSGPTGLPSEIEMRLRSFAADEGLDYEHKPHGGALHYRARPERGPDALAFAQTLAKEHGWSVQAGKCVVELVAKGANKGGAVSAFMHEAPFADSRPIFIGDDLTDEAGFAACNEFGGAGILVGNRKDTCARYQLCDVQAVHDWLEW